METRREGSEGNGHAALPTPEEAAAALRQVEESEQAAMTTDGGPRWYWPALGALLAVQAFIPLISTDDARGWVLWAGANLVWLVALGLVVGLLVRSMGVVYRFEGRELLRGQWPLVVAAVLFVVASGVTGIQDLVGWRIAVSLATAVFVTAYGLWQQGRMRRAAKGGQARTS